MGSCRDVKCPHALIDMTDWVSERRGMPSAPTTPGWWMHMKVSRLELCCASMDAIPSRYRLSGWGGLIMSVDASCPATIGDANA